AAAVLISGWRMFVGRGLVVVVASCALAGAAAGSDVNSRGDRFVPAGASFLNAKHGWVLGQSGCRSCAELRVTRDGGERWTALPALPMPLGFPARSPRAVTAVYFANAKNG